MPLPYCDQALYHRGPKNSSRDDLPSRRSKLQRVIMNKTMHGIVLAFFAFACWCVAIILKLPRMVAPKISHPLPAFSRFCMGVGPIVLLGLVLLALGYCLFVWLRTAETRSSWVAFLAASVSMVVLSMMPTVIAIYLPIVDFIHTLPRS